jgi:hypothetical protein
MFNIFKKDKCFCNAGCHLAWQPTSALGEGGELEFRLPGPSAHKEYENFM